MADVQRPGRIGADELDHDLVAGEIADAAVALALRKHAADSMRDGPLRKAEIDEAGGKDFGRLDQAGGGHGGGDPLRDLERLAAQRAGEAHRDRRGPVAMRRVARQLERDLGMIVDGNAGGGEISRDAVAQQRLQRFADREVFRLGGHGGLPIFPAAQTRGAMQTVTILAAGAASATGRSDLGKTGFAKNTVEKAGPAD